MGSHGVWETRVRQLLDEQRSRGNSMKLDITRALATLATAQRGLDALSVEHAAAHARFEKEVKKLLSRRDDPEVLVRNYNESTIETYHADMSCGWVRSPQRMRYILLSEAAAKGYGPCYSCGYRVPNKRAS